MFLKSISALLFVSMVFISCTVLAASDQQILMLVDTETDEKHSGREKADILTKFLLGVRGHLSIAPIGPTESIEFLVRSSDKRDKIKYILEENLATAGGRVSVAESLERLNGELDLREASTIIVYSNMRSSGMDESRQAFDFCKSLEILRGWADLIEGSQTTNRKLIVFLRDAESAPSGYAPETLSSFDCRNDVLNYSLNDLLERGLAKLRSDFPDLVWLYGDAGLENILCGELSVTDDADLCRQPTKSKFNLVVEIDKKVLNKKKLRRRVESGISKNIYGVGPVRRIENMTIRKGISRRLPGNNDIWVKVERGQRGDPYVFPRMEISIPRCGRESDQITQVTKVPLQPSREDAAFWVAEQINRILPAKLNTCWQVKRHNLTLTLYDSDNEPLLGDHQLKLSYVFAPGTAVEEVWAGQTGNPGEYALDEFPRGVHEAKLHIIPYWGKSGQTLKEFDVATLKGSALEMNSVSVYLPSTAFSQTAITLRPPTPRAKGDVELKIFMRSLESDQLPIKSLNTAIGKEIKISLLPGSYIYWAIPNNYDLLSRKSILNIEKPGVKPVRIALLTDALASEDDRCDYLRSSKFVDSKKGKLARKGRQTLNNSALILESLLRCTSLALKGESDLSRLAIVWSAIDSHLELNKTGNCSDKLFRAMRDDLELRDSRNKVLREHCDYVRILFTVIMDGKRQANRLYRGEPEIIEEYNTWVKDLADSYSDQQILDEDVAKVLSISRSQ